MADLRFGTFLAPNMLPVYQAIADFVGAQLGLSTELVVETDYRNCVNDVNDVSFVCSLPYVTYERQGLTPAVPIAAPILKGERYGGRPVYFSDVIVRRDSPASSFLDLRGCSWAYNESLSQSGYGITRHHLVSIGETDGFFGVVVEAGFHQAAIDMVRRGEVDAAAIDSHVLEVAMRTNPPLRDEIAIVDVLGPSTIQPITVTKRLPNDSRREIQRVLTELHLDRTMRAHLDFGLIDRITAVDESDYDDIRRMLDECEAAGFMEIR